ncbi:unnamed protein product [Paramecium primaurelia]|uniref:Uncharacterized protein n=1 Tax=Paramecium primaurelia TaxID=5886 RepID=A0A8S1MCG0_PARPR|nr:unnamed protein product [Paramecium primaurelia]
MSLIIINLECYLNSIKNDIDKLLKDQKKLILEVTEDFVKFCVFHQQFDYHKFWRSNNQII